MFDNRILPVRQFNHPIIGVGNLTVGGTGKTPHTEFLVRTMLDEQLTVATLSRGYKRKTNGFRLASAQSTAKEIGDEPLQMSRTFPSITVAVDENRCHGIDLLLEDKQSAPDVIILDDAFQHRYVKPGLNILLIDYTQPAFTDHMLPRGRLREPFAGKNRADIVVVTKCPKHLTPIDFRIVEQELRLMPFQKLFFSTIEYDSLRPLFGDNDATLPLKALRNIEHSLLLTGIANPEPLRQDLMRYGQRITPLTFADHHVFTHTDAEHINTTFKNLAADDKIIITTAKDATRLQEIEPLLSDKVKQALYVLPIHVAFLRNEERTFKRIITDYVRKQN